MKNSMKRMFTWFDFFSCCGCHKIIFPFHFYYDVSVRVRGMGPFHNQAHCCKCHDKSVIEQQNNPVDKRCKHCANSVF
jgi:hypothetical protein